MSSDTALEQRVAAVEDAVTELRQRFASRPASIDWVEEVAGSISDEAAFAEALAYAEPSARLGIKGSFWYMKTTHLSRESCEVEQERLGQGGVAPQLAEGE